MGLGLSLQSRGAFAGGGDADPQKQDLESRRLQCSAISREACWFPSVVNALLAVSSFGTWPAGPQDLCNLMQEPLCLASAGGNLPAATVYFLLLRSYLFLLVSWWWFVVVALSLALCLFCPCYKIHLRIAC